MSSRGCVAWAQSSTHAPHVTSEFTSSTHAVAPDPLASAVNATSPRAQERARRQARGGPHQSQGQAASHSAQHYPVVQTKVASRIQWIRQTTCATHVSGAIKPLRVHERSFRIHQIRGSHVSGFTWSDRLRSFPRVHPREHTVRHPFPREHIYISGVVPGSKTRSVAFKPVAQSLEKMFEDPRFRSLAIWLPRLASR